MKKIINLSLLLTVFLYSCKKNTTENINLSKAVKAPVNAISNPLGNPNQGIVTTYKTGTLIANTTYTVVGNIVILPGDTLFVQPGVNVCVENGASIIVQGALVAIGTEQNPIWFTRCGRPKTDNVGQSQATDSAWSGGSENGIWVGIEGDTSCTLMVLKWTHVEFVGAGANNASCAAFCDGIAIGATQTNYGIWFQNPNGHFIMEDSWEYGTQDDAIRISYGNFDIMRNMFEKQGYIGGDCNNTKSGSVGDCAYNLYLGTATNGSKASNKGSEPVECNMNIYNNTYINGGYRQTAGQKGACINYEQGAEGYCYNNLVIDCKVGIRVVNSPLADTVHIHCGNNFIYGDSTDLTTQFYPVGYITHPSAYVVPDSSVTGYVYDPGNGAAQPTGTELADDVALDGANNPMFVSFPLPENPGNFPGMTTFLDINNDNGNHNWDFHLASGSPAIGIGNPTAAYMLNACASVTFRYVTYLNNQYMTMVFTTNESIPCSDIGCYPYTNTSIGNQHLNGEN